jgi:hypothetical protein
MSFLAPRLRWLSAGGAEPAHETRPVQYVPLLPKMSCNHLCALHSHGRQSLAAFPRDCPWQSRLEHCLFMHSVVSASKSIVSGASYLYSTGGYGGHRTGGRADGHTDGLDHFRAYVDVSHMCSAVHGCSLEVLDVDGSPSEVLWSICASTDEQTGAGAPGERADDMGFIRGGRRTLIFMLPDTSALLQLCPAVMAMGGRCNSGLLYHVFSPLRYLISRSHAPWHQIIQRWVTWLL